MNAVVRVFGQLVSGTEGRVACAPARTSPPDQVGCFAIGIEDTPRTRAINKVELLCSKPQPPSIEKVWLALQEVVGGAENISAHRRDNVELAMVRNLGEAPTYLATLIVKAAGL